MRRAKSRSINGFIEKKCTICGEFKPLMEFRAHKTGYLHCDSRCIPCLRIELNAYVAKEYGLTHEKYLEMIGNGCDVCGSMDKIGIDHDHQTGKVRGVLCGHCNKALGLLKEDINRILKLAHYLEEKYCQPKPIHEIKVDNACAQ